MILFAKSDWMSNEKEDADEDKEDEKVLDGQNSAFSLESSDETKK
jgi:hypothetical protein